MSNYLESNKRIHITLSILAGLMLLIICGIYPNNYEQLFTPVNRLFDFFYYFSFGLFVCVLFSKKRISGEKKTSTIKYMALTATLGIAGAFFSYVAAPEFIDAYGVRSTTILLDWFGPFIWATYVPFMILELLDRENKLPNWFMNIKRYIYAITMILAIAISMIATSNTVPSLVKQMFDIELSPYLIAVIISILTSISLFRGINKGMGVFSVVAMLMMGVIVLFFLYKSITGKPFEYMINESVIYFGQCLGLHDYIPNEFNIKCHYPYMCWGFCWSSIIGKFMITLSEGRTLRTAAITNILVPTVVCWLYIFISRYTFIYSGESYNLLESYPIIGILYVVMVTMMFITSADSTGYSIDQEISKGQKATSNYRKLLWIFVILGFTTIMLALGGESGNALYAIDYLASPVLLITCITGLIIGGLKYIKNYYEN